MRQRYWVDAGGTGSDGGTRSVRAQPGRGDGVRAVVLEEIGRPAMVRELELIEPRAGEVRVRMLASGVCHSDLHVVEGEWPEDPPIVLGHQGFGAVGAGGEGGSRRGATVSGRWRRAIASCCPGTRRAAPATAVSRAGRGSASARAR